MKTKKTIELEQQIYKATKNAGTFGCFEVTIGWFGKERVDYMTYNVKGEFRCYEIKVSKRDFHSKSATTFLGHYNYYVMPQELYEEVKDEIPDWIGVYTDLTCVKKAKKQDLKVDEKILKDSLIRSLSRDVDKQIKSRDPLLIDYYRRELNSANRDRDNWQKQYNRVYKTAVKLYGRHWEDGEHAKDKNRMV